LDRRGQPPAIEKLDVADRHQVLEVQQHLERISQLPKPQQKMLMAMIDAVLAQQGR
jgi:hypothetical protein